MMKSTGAAGAPEQPAFRKRLAASLPGVFLFAIMVYFSVNFASFAIATTAPIWLRLPFFLYCAFTIFVGLQVALRLFPTEPTRSESMQETARQVTGWLFSIICCGSAIGLISLLARFPASYTPSGSLLFSFTACVLFVASLVFPVKAIRKKRHR